MCKIYPGVPSCLTYPCGQAGGGTCRVMCVKVVMVACLLKGGAMQVTDVFVTKENRWVVGSHWKPPFWVGYYKQQKRDDRLLCRDSSAEKTRGNQQTSVPFPALPLTTHWLGRSFNLGTDAWSRPPPEPKAGITSQSRSLSLTNSEESARSFSRQHSRQPLPSRGDKREAVFLPRGSSLCKPHSFTYMVRVAQTHPAGLLGA